MKVRTDLCGKKFGRLTAVCQDGVDASGKNARWRCRCDCGRTANVNRPGLIQGKTRSCGCLNSPPIDDYEKRQEANFWRFVNKQHDCWLWVGAIDKQGYGTFNDRGKTIKAHRYSYHRFVSLIPPGSKAYVCHTCDTPACVNPAHLYLGSHADNMRDMSNRKRWGPKRKRLSAKQKQACQILFDGGMSLHEIAEVLNISHPTARKYSEKS